MIHFRSRGTPTALARILIASLLLTGCGSGYPIPPELENTTLVEGTTVEEAPQSEEMPDLDAMGMDVSSMVDQNLPEDFPDAFPIPPGAEVFSNIHMPNEGEYWVYFSITDPLADAIGYFQKELPRSGWTILEEQETGAGYQFKIETDEYGGELLLVRAETGVALDVHLLKGGMAESIPDIESLLRGSSTLGENSGNLPSDLPIPASFERIGLSPELEADGYAAAFQYQGAPLLAMVDFNLAMFSSGWLVGDEDISEGTNTFIVDFTDPALAFKGYALITDDFASYGIPRISGSLIALHEGLP